MNRKENSVYLISGGPGSDPEKMVSFCRTALAASGKEHPSVAYVGTASGDDLSFFRYLKKIILKAGASSVSMVPLANSSPDIPAARKMLSDSDAVFLTGGEVDEGMLWLEKSGMDQFLKQLFSEGRLFFGISAGAIMMGENWAHWEIEDDDDTASLICCLSFIPLTLDAHGEEENWQELKCVLRLKGSGARGYGMVNGGFFRVSSSGKIENMEKALLPFENKDGKIEVRKK